MSERLDSDTTDLQAQIDQLESENYSLKEAQEELKRNSNEEITRLHHDIENLEADKKRLQDELEYLRSAKTDQVSSQ